MGGIRCYKEVLDTKSRVDVEVTKNLIVVRQVGDCMQVTMSAAPAYTFDEEMEDIYIEAANRYAASIKQAAEAYTTIMVGLEKEARKRWPEEMEEKK